MTKEQRLRKALLQLSARLDGIAEFREQRSSIGMNQHNLIGHLAALRSLARYADWEANLGVKK